MPSFTPLRVLVTLVVVVSVLSGEALSRPLPLATPPIRRAPIQLISTSPTLPLPPSVMAGQRRSGGFTQQRPDPIILTGRDVDPVKRSDIHEHIHEHIHGHDSDYDNHDDLDRWTKEEMEHHSDHWAWHHGLLHDPESADVHAHVHEHIHTDKRGLIGDTVRPLLAPLNVLPGFITISNLLFGDGAEDGGLLKTIGGLLLRVETSKQSPNEYAFSLLASKHQRSQVYLAPVNDTSCDNGDSNDDSITVKLTLPSLDINGAAVLMCASFAVAPPSALSLESCHNDDTSDSMVVNGTSQFFTYTRSTGALTPILLQNKTMNAIKAANTLTLLDDSTTNATTPATSTDDAPTKSQLLMHFTLVSSDAQSEAEDSTDDSTDGNTDDGETTDNFPLADAADSSSSDMTERDSHLVSRQLANDGTDSSASNTTAPVSDQDDNDDSKIFLAVTLLSEDAAMQSDDATDSSSSSSTSKKLCKAKM